MSETQPRKIRLLRHVRSDIPGSRITAAPGVYEAHLNLRGAVSVSTLRGMLGVRPDEFEWLPEDKDER